MTRRTCQFNLIETGIITTIEHQVNSINRQTVMLVRY